jgi:hypothetical protein
MNKKNKKLSRKNKKSFKSRNLSRKNKKISRKNKKSFKLKTLSRKNKKLINKKNSFKLKGHVGGTYTPWHLRVGKSWFPQSVSTAFATGITPGDGINDGNTTDLVSGYDVDYEKLIGNPESGYGGEEDAEVPGPEVELDNTLPEVNSGDHLLPTWYPNKNSDIDFYNENVISVKADPVALPRASDKKQKPTPKRRRPRKRRW